MKELLTYVAQAGVLSIGAWIAYKVLFSRDTLHRVRRFVLLAMLAGCFALPVCRVTIEREVAAGLGIDHLPDMTTGLGIDHLAVIETAPAPTQETAPVPIRAEADRSPFRWMKNVLGAGWILYLAGVAVMLAFRMTGVVRVRQIMRRAVDRRVTDDGIEVLLLDDDVSPFSFGGRIVLSKGDWRGEGADMIVRHETVHVRQRHGIDLAVMNVATAVLWFVPFVWLLRRELILVHEIAADSGVIHSGFNAKLYQYLLISKFALPGGLLPAANHFRTSDLRKRIMTMKRTTSRIAAFKALLLLPLVAIALAAFAETRHVAAENTAEVATPTAELAPQNPVVADEPVEIIKNNVVSEIIHVIQPKKEELNIPFEGEIKTRPDGTETNTIGPVGLYGNRIDPVTGETALHSGIDVVPVGDTIRAPYSGVVSSAAFEQAMGNKLVIDHGNGLETTYGHLARFLVSEGATVEGGQPIAIVGNTGQSTGRHLHLETRVDGELTDPLETLFGMTVTRAERHRTNYLFISFGIFKVPKESSQN